MLKVTALIKDELDINIYNSVSLLASMGVLNKNDLGISTAGRHFRII